MSLHKKHFFKKWIYEPCTKTINLFFWWGKQEEKKEIVLPSLRQQMVAEMASNSWQNKLPLISIQ